MHTLYSCFAVSGLEAGLFLVISLIALGAIALFALGAYFFYRTVSELTKLTENARKLITDSEKRTAAEAPIVQQQVPKKTQTTATLETLPATKPTAMSASDEEDPAIFAVIAAAIHSVIGDREHRIVSIRAGAGGWAQEGRRQIFSSHRVR